MEIAMIVVFCVGYLLIAFEHAVKLNKAASALLTGAVCWVIYATFQSDKVLLNHQLAEHLGEIAGILFFLLGAMVIVELIDAHDGFELITARIHQHNKMRLMWVIGLLAFVLSAILDNLTTTIVMASVLRKLVDNEKDRIYFISLVVIAANAGGAWSPIGDVTTTMLWIGGQISSSAIIKSLIIPSLVCLAVPLLVLSFRITGNVERPQRLAHRVNNALPVRQQTIVLVVGLAMLLAVPVFKTVTHLPPYLGMLAGLAVLWIVTEMLHGKREEKERSHLTVVSALQKSDTPSILFFFGILMSIGALQTAGLLNQLSEYLTANIQSKAGIAVLFGAMSAVVDNVPLLAAVQGMFDLSVWPMDHPFWHLLAYTTGTGGSLLIIGSAAGVAAMGAEKITFFGYLRSFMLLAMLGYLSGAAVFLLANPL